MRKLASFLTLLATGCKSNQQESPVLPDPSEADFVRGVEHPYFPLLPGSRWLYASNTDEGLVEVEVRVNGAIRVVNGVNATVVRDTRRLDGEIVRDTYDWFAQDEVGNVWCLGEDTCEYEGGECVSTEGSWEWGVDGASPGWMMPAIPVDDGQAYYQEFLVDEAEDVGQVVDVNVVATVPFGAFEDCIRTRDTTRLEPDVEEFKTYCPDLGLVLTESDGETESLTEFTLREL